MNTRIVPRRAGNTASRAVHTGLLLNGAIIQPRFSRVGLNSLGTFKEKCFVFHFRFVYWYKYIHSKYINSKCHMMQLSAINHDTVRKAHIIL
jgi:hypothetical protein